MISTPYPIPTPRGGFFFFSVRSPLESKRGYLVERICISNTCHLRASCKKSASLFASFVMTISPLMPKWSSVAKLRICWKHVVWEFFFQKNVDNAHSSSVIKTFWYYIIYFLCLWNVHACIRQSTTSHYNDYTTDQHLETEEIRYTVLEITK